MKRAFVLEVVLMLLVLPARLVQGAPPQRCERTASGQTSESQDQIATELKAIQLQLDRIEKHLAAVLPGEQRVTLDVSANNAIGSKSAPVTIVEFTDYQCPFCRQFQTEAFQKLKENYIDKGKVRFVSLDLPLKMHANALKAAQAAWCAGDQSKYWEMRSLLLANDNLGAEAALAYADKLGMDKASFRACFDSDKYAKQVNAETAQAGDLGISGTPTFIVGRTEGKAVDGVKLMGILSYAQLESRITTLLNALP